MTPGGPSRQEHGIALILVLLVMGALSVILLDLNYSTRVNLHRSENFRDEAKASSLALGAVEAAVYWLKNDESPDYDALCEADDPSCENSWSLDNPGMEVGDGLVQLKIRDEDGKIWINDTKTLFRNNLSVGTGLPPLLVRLRDLLELEPEIFDSIQDWIDQDDEVFGDGAESDYYQSLDPPYQTRNGPLLDLSELLMVKGIGDGLYFGHTEEHPIGLTEIFTVFSTGTINVNTAPAVVLSALGDGIDGEVIADDRRGAPFKTRAEFTSYFTQEFPGVPVPNQSLWDVQSTYFSATVRVRLHRVAKFARAVLKRDKNNVTIISWHEE